MKKANTPEVVAATVAAPSQAKKAATSAAATVKANIVEMLIKRDQHLIYRAQANPEAKLSAKQAKQFRQKMRRQLDNFDLKIRVQKNAETRKAAITEFLAFYKANYILNDFSLSSLTDSRDAAKRESYGEMLKIVQASMGK